jgi:hypothetical protein
MGRFALGTSSNLNHFENDMAVAGGTIENGPVGRGFWSD